MIRKTYKALTLIEFLLAFTIFAIISLSIYACFSSAMQINKRSKNFEHGLRSVLWSLETIQSDVENMLPYTFDVQDPPRNAFGGNEKEFSFILGSKDGLKQVRFFLADPQNIKIHEVKLGIRSEKNVRVTTGQTLNKKPVQYLMRQEKSWAGPLEDEILNKNIIKDSFKISYARTEKDRLVWEKQWNDSAFPAGIRIEFRWNDPDNAQQELTIEKTIIIPLGVWGKIKQ